MTPSPAPAVVRVAPSPTGDPHVGTAYIALFDLVFARRTGGRFILRIEDTDQTRYSPTSEAQIMESLRWLGLVYDEGPDVGGPNGPYRQSERTDIYREHGARLLGNGTAYRCFCTEERLGEMRHAQRARKAPPGYDGLCRGLLEEEVQAHLAAGTPFVVRLRVPKDRTVVFHDELRGKVAIEGHTIDDQVLMKSDGFPTYHLANVVDDRLMGVTDVIRAEEWITSTPKHVLLYEAFGWQAPRFYHMPLLRNADRTKISKRKNPTSLIWYKESGYLPEALVNFLALMGYSHPEGKEVFSLEEMITTFDVARLTTSSPVFDLEKLLWLNGEYIRMDPPERLARRLIEHWAYRRARGTPVEETSEAPLYAWVDAHGGFEAQAVFEFVLATIPLVQERIKRLDEYPALARCFFAKEVGGYPAEDLVPKKHAPGQAKEMIEAVAEAVGSLAEFSPPALEEALRALGEARGWKPRDLFQPVRVAVTGAKVSPPLFESMALIGRNRCLSRLAAAAALV